MMFMWEGEGGEEFMKMMTALPAQKEEQEQQEREEMDEKCSNEKSHLPRRGKCTSKRAMAAAVGLLIVMDRSMQSLVWAIEVRQQERNDESNSKVR
jgi:hypothetical protein